MEFFTFRQFMQKLRENLPELDHRKDFKGVAPISRLYQFGKWGPPLYF